MNFDVTTYAPQNSKELTPEQLAAMEFFTLDQLNQLAKAYPNSSNQRPYLVLKDKSKKDQIWSLVTWANLRDLYVMGLKHFVAISFKDIFFKTRGGQTVKTAPLQDLSRDEVLEGLRVKEVKVDTTEEVVETAPEQNIEEKVVTTDEENEFDELNEEAAAKASGKKNVPLHETKPAPKTKTNKGSGKGKK